MPEVKIYRTVPKIGDGKTLETAFRPAIEDFIVNLPHPRGYKVIQENEDSFDVEIWMIPSKVSEVDNEVKRVKELRANGEI